MRSRIKVDGKWYRPVPWILNGDCAGCAFELTTQSHLCINAGSAALCDDGGEFEGQVLIPTGKEAYEAHIHKAVLTRMDGGEDEDD